MTIQEAIEDLDTSKFDGKERIAEDLQTGITIQPWESTRCLLTVQAILSTRWITRDAR